MVEFLKQVKKAYKITHISKTAQGKSFVATILVTHVTILTEPDLPLQN